MHPINRINFKAPGFLTIHSESEQNVEAFCSMTSDHKKSKDSVKANLSFQYIDF